MKPRPAYSDRYEDALRLAAAVHREQNRKDSDAPYITHLFHVSLILLHHGFSTDTAIAGLLHDAVEDRGLPLSQIEGQFGAHVAEMVAALSEQKKDAQGNERPWKVRKAEALEKARQASPEAVAIKAADALHNARCIVLDARREGPRAWKRFTRGPVALLGNYRQIVHLAQERLGAHSLVTELTDAVNDLAEVIDQIGVDEEYQE